MTIWILLFVVLVLMAGLGFVLGAIRAAVMLIGVILGGVLAMPLAPWVKPIFTQFGMSHTVWLWLFPPLLVFALVWILSIGLSFGAYHPVAVYFKYRANDIERAYFERLNQRLGICVGLLAGVVASVWAGVAIFVPGYMSFQFANDEQDPAWLKFINKARNDMHETGFDRLIAPFNPAPKKYYEVADVLALLYRNNPGVLGRLYDYPAFLSLSERQEFKDMAGDKDFMEALQGKTSLATLVIHPRIEGIINSPELAQFFLGLDLKDFGAYLQKGTSPKFDPYKILGRWELDGDQVVINAKKKNPDINTKALRAMRTVLSTMAAGTVLTATTDNKITLVTKGMIVDIQKMAQQVQAQQAAQAAAAAPARRPGSLSVAPSALAPAVRARMDPRYQAAIPVAPAPPPPAAAEPVPLKLETKTYEGSWEGDGDAYTIKMRDEKGKESSSDGTVEGDYLIFTVFGQQLVFVRQA